MTAQKAIVLREFGEAVRQARKRAGISQERLALDAGLHRTYVSQIERGIANPSLWSIASLASVIGVRVRYLLRSV